MKQLSEKAKELLITNGYHNQSEVARLLGCNRHTLNRNLNNGDTGVKTLSKIYSLCGEDFELVNELKAHIREFMDSCYNTTLPESQLGISYTSARHIAYKDGGLTMRAIERLYENDKKSRAIIDRYC